MQSSQNRFMLAVGVGMGKTIETGLILKELKIRGDIKRILVIVPKSSMMQWQSELKDYFNEVFHLYDSEMIISMARTFSNINADEEYNFWTQHNQIIVSTDALKPLEKRQGWSQERVEEYNKYRMGAVLEADLKDYYFLDLESGRFNKVPEYPEEAWLEGIVNALCHRSYNVQGSAIYIKHFDNRIEISNSGPLPAQVTVENIKTERYARNPRIARALEDMGFVRQLNEGVSRIYQSMEKSMLSKPEYKVQNGSVYLTLRNKISQHTKTIPDFILETVQSSWAAYNDTQRRILQFLFNNNKATIADFVKEIGIHEKNIRLYLNQFLDDEIIVRLSDKIRDKNAQYAFKKH